MSGAWWAVSAGLGFGLFRAINRRAVRGMSVPLATFIPLLVSAVVRHVAGHVAALGERLRAGEVVMTGSIVPPPLWIGSGEASRFTLDPLDTISINLTLAAGQDEDGGGRSVAGSVS